MSNNPCTPTERVVVLTLHLAQGHAVTTAEVARLLTMCDSGAYRMLDRMSRVAPIVNEAGRWSLLPTN